MQLPKCWDGQQYFGVQYCLESEMTLSIRVPSFLKYLSYPAMLWQICCKTVRSCQFTPELASLSQGTGCYLAAPEMEDPFGMTWRNAGCWDGRMQGERGVAVAKSCFWWRCQFTLLCWEELDSITHLQVVAGAYSWHSTPNLQKCCNLAGQRFLNQLIKRKQLLSSDWSQTYWDH